MAAFILVELASSGIPPDVACSTVVDRWAARHVVQFDGRDMMVDVVLLMLSIEGCGGYCYG